MPELEPSRLIGADMEPRRLMGEVEAVLDVEPARRDHPPLGGVMGVTGVMGVNGCGSDAMAPCGICKGAVALGLTPGVLGREGGVESVGAKGIVKCGGDDVMLSVW